MKQNYRNVLAECGISQEDINQRIEDTFQTIFYGNEDERIYHEAGDDMGYLVDTGNNDARTEGMSYGMMICVQLDKKEEFDRIWKWAKTYMYMERGKNKGYFAWSCKLNGKKNAYGPAPDGEEFFAMALFFASQRWGDGTGIFNYSQEAKAILHECVHKDDNYRGFGYGKSMWDTKTKLIRFVPGCNYSDPSYHLPHFYEMFALYTNEEDREFWHEAAKASREYFKVACHKETGLCAEYAEFDGTPCTKRNMHGYRFDRFYSDAYRTIANIGLDYEWFGASEDEVTIANNLQKFCYEKCGGVMDGIYEIDGTVLDGKALHPIAIIATNAQASLAANGSYAKECVMKFWNTPLRTGERRYYDNLLYFFALLALSGNYRMY